MLSKVSEILNSNMQAKVDDVIKWLNPIIRGWGNYYRYSNSKETFAYIDFRIWQMLWRWVLRRHNNKGKKWVRQKYFPTVNGRKWVFSNKRGLNLIFMASIPIYTRYTKVKGYNSPYDPDLNQYWLKRTRSK